MPPHSLSSFEIQKFYHNQPRFNGVYSRDNLLKMQEYDSIMCRYFCTGFIDFILAGKTLADFTNLFSPK